MEKEINHQEEISYQEEEKGASMVEYALLAALIAVVAIAAITFLGEEVSQTFNSVATSLNNT